MARGRRTTISDVARVAAVDPAVVSKVLSGDPKLSIRPETRARVLEAVRSTGYVPNVLARGLRTAQSGTIGLFIPDFSNPVFAEVISGAESEAAVRGYALLTGSSSTAGSAESFLGLLGQGRVDGVLLAGEVAGGEALGALASTGIPYLFLNRRVPESRRNVVLDDARATELAVEHLVGLGHTIIGHVAGPDGADTAVRRREGFERAMRDAGLTLDERFVVSAPYTSDGGRDGMTRVLGHAQRPTAVVVANFVAAVGALAAAHEAGVGVPDDLSIIAVHDSPIAWHTVPALTTVRLPLRRLGALGVELLLTRAADDAIDDVLEGPLELIARASSAAPPV